MLPHPAAPVRLGVNIDHVATIRNARGGTHPDPFTVALAVAQAGADGITIHLREDRRHIRDEDAQRLCAWAATAAGLPVNLEMAATEEMAAIALALRPHAVCIVPERRAEITTEGGLDAAGLHNSIAPLVAQLDDAGIAVSLFIDPDEHQVRAAAAMRARVVELHTGAYANGRPGELERLRVAAALTPGLGLECHAGHGLTFGNVAPIAALPEIRELNIGHYLIGEAMVTGLPAAVAEMKRLIDEARS